MDEATARAVMERLGAFLDLFERCRPAVVTRKMAGGGNRSLRVAATQQVLASVLRTAHLRDFDAVPLVVDLLRAQTPTVSAALRAPRQ